MNTFENPSNGYRESFSNRAAFWLTLLLGCLYLAYKGAYKHALVALVAAFFTGGLAWLVYPWFASKILRQSYLERGWRAVA